MPPDNHTLARQTYSDHRGCDGDSYTKALLLASMSHIVRSSANINSPRELQHFFQPFLWLWRAFQKPS